MASSSLDFHRSGAVCVLALGHCSLLRVVVASLAVGIKADEWRHPTTPRIDLIRYT